MRKLLVAAVAILAAAGLSACNDAQTKGARAQAKQLTIGVSVPAADHGWTAGIGWWAKQAMDMHPDVKWVYQTADKPDKQVDDIKAMMSQQKLDALVILATESAPLTPIAEEAASKGIYIVNVDRGFLKPVANVFIEGDNEAFGRKSAEYMVERLGGKGEIVVLRGIPCTVDTDRYNAAMAVFKRHPDIKVLGEAPAYWNREKGLEAMKKMLVQHKKIDAVWAQDDDIALGAEQAIREAGRDKEMWMLGGAGMKDIVKRVMDKDAMYPADITYPPSMIAVGIHMCVSNLRDGQKDQVEKFMPRHMKLDVELVTPENAAKHYFPNSVY
jgi:ribose transport system substrate-binding protein